MILPVISIEMRAQLVKKKNEEEFTEMACLFATRSARKILTGASQRKTLFPWVCVRFLYCVCLEEDEIYFCKNE